MKMNELSERERRSTQPVIRVAYLIDLAVTAIHRGHQRRRKMRPSLYGMTTSVSPQRGASPSESQPSSYAIASGGLLLLARTLTHFAADENGMRRMDI
jgi:hypothetical protein